MFPTVPIRFVQWSLNITYYWVWRSSLSPSRVCSRRCRPTVSGVTPIGQGWTMSGAFGVYRGPSITDKFANTKARVPNFNSTRTLFHQRLRSGMWICACSYLVHVALYPFLRASAMLKHVIDIGWTSVCLSIRLSVCHTLVLYQNGCFLHHTIAIHSSFVCIKIFAKFRRVHPLRGR